MFEGPNQTTILTKVFATLEISEESYRHISWSNYFRDLTRPHSKWWFSEGNPRISGKPRLAKYYHLARYQRISWKKWFFIILGFTIFSCQKDTESSDRGNAEAEHLRWVCHLWFCCSYRGKFSRKQGTDPGDSLGETRYRMKGDTFLLLMAEIRRENQLRLVVYAIIFRVLYIPEVVSRISELSTVVNLLLNSPVVRWEVAISNEVTCHLQELRGPIV